MRSTIRSAALLGTILSLTLTATIPCRAELRSVEVPGLQGFYGGAGGESQTDDFDFGQSFPFIGSAWIHVHGAADVRAPTDVNFFWYSRPGFAATLASSASCCWLATCRS